MIIHDFSNLLKAIDEVKLEETKLNNEIEAKNKNKLAELETKLINSGMIEDWRSLCKSLRKLNMRTCPYPENIEGYGCFDDGSRFRQCMSSGSHWSDYFGIDINSEIEVKYCISHSTTTTFWKGFDKSWSGDMGDEIETKIKLIQGFMKQYPVYKEIMLKKIYEELGKRMEHNEELKGELNK